MAHLESMRYRKQPGTIAIYEDATVISGMSPGTGGTTPVTGEGEDPYGARGPIPDASGAGYGYEKKDLDYLGISSSTTGDNHYPSGSNSSSERYPRLNITRGQWMTLGLIVVLAAYVRLWRLSNPANVVFDEVHFG
ncbi:hypothetical protein IW150_007616, partial [Coemansia sp. RSA 2607]